MVVGAAQFRYNTLDFLELACEPPLGLKRLFVWLVDRHVSHTLSAQDGGCRRYLLQPF
jgi:hypothetical protein